ncbi:hypothetical protein ZEAMMB73_Zm00001d018704 [Zea mays]|uniref:Uncharacterized protein n=1 Tax=Zea mays TaxID=4577 RepID=A0A1D6HRN8_MAIZE|nr:hypothetical protein ZEAMMB73_Zm00001d018704 [Zea mays]
MARSGAMVSCMLLLVVAQLLMVMATQTAAAAGDQRGAGRRLLWQSRLNQQSYLSYQVSALSRIAQGSQISDTNSIELPCIMWLKVYKPKRFDLSCFINWVRTTKHTQVVVAGVWRLVCDIPRKKCMFPSRTSTIEDEVAGTRGGASWRRG